MSSTNLISRKFFYIHYCTLHILLRFLILGNGKQNKKTLYSNMLKKKVVYMVNEGKYQVGKQISAFSKKQIFILQYRRDPAKCSKYIRENKMLVC